MILPAPASVLTSSTAATHDVSQMLRHYPKGMLATPLQVRIASFTSTPARAPAWTWRPGTGSVDTGASLGGFTSLIERRHLTPGFVALALSIAMFWGSVHALSPGHGKSLVAAYLVGSRARARHARAPGATVTSRTRPACSRWDWSRCTWPTDRAETLYPWLAVLSGLMVVGVGSTILAAAGCAAATVTARP